MKRDNGFYFVSEINIFGRMPFVRLEVLTAVTVKSSGFRGVTPCTLVDFTDLLEQYTTSVFRAEE